MNKMNMKRGYYIEYFSQPADSGCPICSCVIEQTGQSAGLHCSSYMTRSEMKTLTCALKHQQLA